MVNNNFTKKNLYNEIYKKIGFSKNLSSKITDNFLESLISELIKSNLVKLTSFGTFEIIQKKERIGRNPKTKVEARISSRRVVQFKPSLLIKKKLNKTWKIKTKLVLLIKL